MTTSLVRFRKDWHTGIVARAVVDAADPEAAVAMARAALGVPADMAANRTPVRETEAAWESRHGTPWLR